MKIYIALLLIALQGFLLRYHALAQDTEVKPLYRALAAAHSDTGRIRVLEDLSSAWLSDNPDSATWYAEKANALAQSTHNNTCIAGAAKCLGRSYWRQGRLPEALALDTLTLKTYGDLSDSFHVAQMELYIAQDYTDMGTYDMALDYLNRSQKDFTEHHDDTYLANVYDIFSYIYSQLGNKPEATKYLYDVLRLCEKFKDKEGIAVTLSNIGDLDASLGNDSGALRNLKKSCALLIEVPDKINLALTYISIGGIYLHNGLIDSARASYMQSLSIAQSIHNPSAMAKAEIALGKLYNLGKNYKDALHNYLQAADLYISVDNMPDLVSLYADIGVCYVMLHQFGPAGIYFDKDLALAQKLNSIEYMNTYYAGVIAYDSATGHWKQAYEHHKLFLTTRDSISNKENTQKLVRTQMQYDFDKKETAQKAEQEKKEALSAEELKRQRTIRNGFVGGFTVMLLFAGVFWSQRNRIRREKNRSDELLLNILPRETAEELKTTGIAKAKEFPQVTVMFTDFRNFTAMSEHMGAQELVNEINFCYSAFDKIISAYPIEKIKTIGDSYMCAGGLPAANTTNAKDIVSAALEIRDFMLREKEKRAADGKSFFEIRIGCHTGPVVAGIVGIKKFAYDIWGDTVNIASRMESGGMPGKVNVSSVTCALVQNDFQCTHRGKIQVKSLGEVDMYFVEKKHTEK